MAATIRVGKVEATVTDGVWTSEAPALANVLNHRIELELDKIWTWDACNPDRAWAKIAIDLFDGVLVSCDPPAPSRPGAIY